MRKRFVFATAIALLIIMITILFNVPSAIAQQQQINSNTSSSLTTSPNLLSLKTIFKQVENSVVQVTSKIPTTGVPNPQNRPSSRRILTTLVPGLFMISRYIVTNGHVVADSGSKWQWYTAMVMAKDIYSDIAVLQILQNASQPQRQLLSSLKPLVLGNSSNLEVGDQVIAIGNPFGISDTMTTGIVSGIGRSLPTSVGGGFFIPNIIQTDAFY